MTTTIKVAEDLRDPLTQQAARDGLTLGAHLTRLADDEDRRWRLQILAPAVAASSSANVKSHAAESEDSERTELNDAP